MNCTDCRLCKNRTNIVSGEGNSSTDTMIVGEAPGAKEDETGRPFVGRSGELLTDMLNQAGYKRKDVYITNLVKCRPPNNRNPKQNEIQECNKYLQKQIEMIEPERIIAVGKFAANVLTGRNEPLGVLLKEQEPLPYQGAGTGVVVVPIYHPSYLLRQGSPDDLVSDMVARIKNESYEHKIWGQYQKFCNT